jgi:predicted PurR-regulated permease PerM
MLPACIVEYSIEKRNLIMISNRPESRGITSTTLQVIFIGLLIAAGFWTIRPFLTPIIWAIIIVVATWPAMVKVQAFARGRRWLAVTVMSVGLLMLLVVPLAITITTIVGKSDEIVGWIKSLSALTVASPPLWLSNVPYLGPKLVVKWQQFAATSSQGLSAKLVPYSTKIVAWFVSQAGNIGMMIFNFLLTVIIASILYAKGETASGGALRLAHRLAGRQGEKTLILAAQAIRGVALGVVLTALIQSVIGGIGLTIVGIPAQMLLTGIMFLLCIAQVGPSLVLIPSVVWLYWSGQTLWGTVLLVFAIVASTIDNLIRPFLIKKGVELPVIVILAGVLGGLVAFGIIGVFIGPVVLAVIYTLLQAWVDESATEGDTDVQNEN